MDITTFLLSAQSANAEVQTTVLDRLRQFQHENLPQFLLDLALELSNDDNPLESRILAGIMLKNSLDVTTTWVSIDSSIRDRIKDLLLNTLGSSDSKAGHTSAQVIAKIASMEIPRKEWPDLIRSLLKNISQQDTPTSLKQATLESLGYVCEEISHNDLAQTEVDLVLNTLVQGMHVSQEHCVRLAAATALCNALNFTQTNFEKKAETNCIMEVICQKAKDKDPPVRKAAFECLVSIASTYYEFLEPYMITLFEITTDGFKDEEKSVAIQAITFWSSICEEEIKRQDIKSREIRDSHPHLLLIQQTRHQLVGLLLQTLLKQDHEDDIWSLSMAAGTCLGLIARTIGDSIVPLVLPTVCEFLIRPVWESRAAGAYALGSILEGPSVETLSSRVSNALTLLFFAMKYQNSHVRYTTVCTLSRIFELLHSPATGSSVISSHNIQRTIQALLESIKDSPHIAEKGCEAIYYIAQGYEAFQSGSSILTPYLAEIITSLVATAERTDVDNSKLRSAAYVALNEVVRCSNFSEASQTIRDLLTTVMAKLETTELQILSPEDREKQGDLQALLCGVLHVIIRKLSSMEETKPSIVQAADRMMFLLLKVFTCKSSAVHKEAMLATRALVCATGPEFGKYMPDFWKYLEMGLKNIEDYQLCAISVGVVNDICRALDVKILPYCDSIMTLLLEDLSSGNLHPSVKPPIFSCFGDVALVIGERFEKYVSHAVPKMQEAADICGDIDVNDEEMVEYGNQLKRSIVEAYSGILKVLKNSKPELMLPHTSKLLKFIEVVIKDVHRDESVATAAVAILGDLAEALGSQSWHLEANY
ncbi:hypothetical protein L1887_39334 [Cichorium endivia]|nr:hypothetical protein L1887_39334 [Cichorium endivia]